ncbi:rim15, signal transduction response regulator, partial [Cladochytrium tenue]
WDTVATTEASFIPQPANDEDTEYFDDRGASKQKLQDTDLDKGESASAGDNTAGVQPSYNLLDDTGAEDFGEFSYRNLPLLAKANNDLVKKLRSDLSTARMRQRQSNSSLGSVGSLTLPARPRNHSLSEALPPMPVIAPSHGLRGSKSLFPLAPSMAAAATPGPLVSSESLPLLAEDETASNRPRARPAAESAEAGRWTLPGRIRSQSLAASGPQRSLAQIGELVEPVSAVAAAVTASVSGTGGAASGSPSSPSPTSSRAARTQNAASASDYLLTAKQALLQNQGRPRSATIVGPGGTLPSLAAADLPPPAAPVLSATTAAPSPPPPPAPEASVAPLDVLVADDNPVACKILETMLSKLNCRCVVVRNGAEMLRCALGDVRFDVIFVDVRMPLVDGETGSRMIKSTNNLNRDTPVVAVTAYEPTLGSDHAFDEVLTKPVSRDALGAVLRAAARPVQTQQLSAKFA